jgi:hypothetical protein
MGPRDRGSQTTVGSNPSPRQLPRACGPFQRGKWSPRPGRTLHVSWCHHRRTTSSPRLAGRAPSMPVASVQHGRPRSTASPRNGRELGGRADHLNLQTGPEVPSKLVNVAASWHLATLTTVMTIPAQTPPPLPWDRMPLAEQFSHQPTLPPGSLPPGSLHEDRFETCPPETGQPATDPPQTAWTFLGWHHADQLGKDWRAYHVGETQRGYYC